MNILTSLKEHKLLINLPENDKAVLVNIGISMLYLSFFCIAYLADRLPPVLQFTDPDMLHLAQKAYLGSVGIMLILLLFVLHMRQKAPNSTLPNIVQMYFIGQPLVLFSVFNGITELVTGLMLGLLPFIGLILFNSKHVFYATVIMWIEILVLAFCVSMEILPNAPLYIEQVKPAQVPLLLPPTK